MRNRKERKRAETGNKKTKKKKTNHPNGQPPHSHMPSGPKNTKVVFASPLLMTHHPFTSKVNNPSCTVPIIISEAAPRTSCLDQSALQTLKQEAIKSKNARKQYTGPEPQKKRADNKSLYQEQSKNQSEKC
jgi:hypothetical protein